MDITRIESNTFKTNETAIFLTVPLKRETITMNALIPAVLRRGTKKLVNQIEIGKALENMYGASFNCGIDKTGSYCVLKFYIETLNEKVLPEKSNLAQEGINLLKDIIFNPLIKENGFEQKYVDQEKENIKKIILSRKDNKAVYAYNRCIEEMFKDEPYGLYKYGYLEDLEKINSQNLYEYYKELIKNCKINIIMTGRDLDKINVPEISDKKISIEQGNHNNQEETKIIKEKMDVNQGKLIIGLDTPTKNKFAVTMYNAVLGGGANSKLFQNVREKASLAYSAGSSFMRRKNAIFIKTGIELNNYEKTLKIIKEQLEDMANGKITEEEIKAAKKLIIASTKMIKESQEDMIAYYFDQKLYNENRTLEDYCNEIDKISKVDIIAVAKEIKINTIYFLEK